MNSLDPNQLFPFPLDKFQLEAIAALNAGKSIVVCAPTGSGKTLLGEYAIYKALATNRRVFYTTPLKALSNQKLRDFRHRFGFDQVGLLTGDTSVNRDAPILVMTTEIFRNMLYGTPIGEVGTSLVGVEAVVLDECHYMNDRSRGTVWEESIIYCPPDIQLVALSATVANSAQLTDWISKVHGATALIHSDFRPVPLEFHFASPKGLFPLLDSTGKKINPRLRGTPRNLRKDKNGKPRFDAPNLPFVISQLQQRDMLPAIHFIFSRKGCDQAIGQLDKMSLVNETEAQQLKTQIDAFLTANPEIGRSQYLSSLYRGIAAHHAGILPAWKGLVEELFQQGLIKVVFATETLAAGINMPARTTVISSLSKRTDRGHRLLTASEFLQMAGRAGRRGMDKVGYVVTVQSPYEGAKDAAELATSPADPLVSQFTPSYGMVLNLLQTHSIEEVRNLVERSFGQYLAGLAMAPQQETIDQLSSQIQQIEAQLACIDLELLAEYEKLRERLREEKRLHKILFDQAEEQRLNELAAYIPFVLSGSLVLIKPEQTKPIAAVIASKVSSSGKFPWLVCLSQTNQWLVISYKDVFLLGTQWLTTELPYPEQLVLKPGQSISGDEQTKAIATQIPNIPFPDLPAEVLTQYQRVMDLEVELNEHVVANWSDRSVIAKKARKLEQLKEMLDYQSQTLQQKQQHHWEEFSSLVSILQNFSFLEGVEPTPLGEVAASLRGDNELWLALALLSGELDHLDPHHLATACAALVTENSRPDSRVNFSISPTVEDALSGLRNVRRQLFQLQRRYNVLIPIWLEYEIVGLIEQWALGMNWQELCQNTTLDEGDIVRIARRTLDLLSQIPHIPHISDSIRQNAIRAIQLVDRFPVNEAI